MTSLLGQVHLVRLAGHLSSQVQHPKDLGLERILNEEPRHHIIGVRIQAGNAQCGSESASWQNAKDLHQKYKLFDRLCVFT